MPRSTPGGSPMNRIGSPWLRNETPACSPGRKPDDHSRPEIACSCSRFDGVATSTTKVGRFWLRLPSPYDAHEPRHGRPVIWLPVCMWQIAGSWLIASVCSERIQQMSSAWRAMLGSRSDSHMPHWPCWAKVYFDGATGKRAWPELMVVRRWPLRIEPGRDLAPPPLI